MANDAKRLLDMKEKVEKAKLSVANIQGALDQIGDRLKKEFNVKTTKEANDLLADIEEEIKELDSQISDKMDKLEREYFNGD